MIPPFLIKITAICCGLTLCVGDLEAQTEPSSLTASADSANADSASTTKAAGPLFTSMDQRLLTSLRTPVSFSIGLFESYTPQNLSYRRIPLPPEFTTLRPRFITRRQTKRTAFIFDYDLAIKRYGGTHGVRAADHAGRLEVDRRASRKTTVQIANVFESRLNDDVIANTSFNFERPDLGTTQALYIPHERFTTNSLGVSVEYQAARKTRIVVAGGYDVWRYHRSASLDSEGVRIGVRGTHRLNRWVSLESSYTHYLNRVSENFAPANIHRVQVGGLSLNIDRNLELHASGGVDFTRPTLGRQTTAAMEGGLTHTSRAGALSLEYRRGFSVAGGPGAIVNGDTVKASITEWLSPGMSFHAGTSYTRGSSTIQRSVQTYMSGNAEVDWQVGRHLLFSTQYSYISQNDNALLAAVPKVARYTVVTGFQFFVSSLTRNRHRTRQIGPSQQR